MGDDLSPFLSLASFWAPQHVMQSRWLEHGPFGYWLIEATQPKLLAEMSESAGFSYLAFCQAVEALALPTICHHFATPPSTPWGGKTIDLLHIDTCQSYEDLARGFAGLRQALSDHAIVVIHAIGEDGANSGAAKLWTELAAEYPSFAFTHGLGLGVLAIGPDIPRNLRRLFDANAATISAIRAIYHRLGESHRLQYRAEELNQKITALEQLDRQNSLQQREIEQLSLRLAGAEARMFALEHSTTWRLTMVICQLLSRLPKSVRSAIRHCAHFLRLIIAPHQIPAKLRRRRSPNAANFELAGQIRASGLFDIEWYLTNYPDVASLAIDPVVHYLQWGVAERRNPSRFFDTAFYLASNPDVAAAGMNPLLHFISHGQREGRQHTPVPKIIFIPDPDRDTHLPVCQAGNYHLSAGANEYCYVPPRRPRDFDRKISAMVGRPLFSIVVPTYNTDADLLARLLASVEAQWYSEWELILADDASTQQTTRQYLANLDDRRIKVIFSTKNSGISGATNLALSRARGNYVVFLDHDDELTADCLYELAMCITAENPDFIYSDEDKIAADGRFAEPFFKPDWSPDTLMSTMFTCHVCCVRRSLIEELGGLRTEFDGSQDWDLILRATERTNRIAHIPKILYHWRIIPSSAAGDLGAKPYAITAGQNARLDALKRRGLSGNLEPLLKFPGYSRVRYDLNGSPLISIIIPSRDNGKILKRCIDSIQGLSTYRNFEIILLDNGSTDRATLDTLIAISNSPKITIIRHDAPFNYSELNNIGVNAAKGELLLFLNDDTEVRTRDWLERMGGYAQLGHVGAVGAKLLYPGSGLIQHGGVLNLADGPNHAFLMQSADNPGYFCRNVLEYNWIAVTGACLMIERHKFFAVGPFDEELPVAYNDVDLCFNLINSGYYNVVCSAVQLVHHESVSRGNDLASAEKRARLDRERRKLYINHPHFLLRDPFYSENLAPNSVNFDLPS